MFCAASVKCTKYPGMPITVTKLGPYFLLRRPIRDQKSVILRFCSRLKDILKDMRTNLPVTIYSLLVTRLVTDFSTRYM